MLFSQESRDFSHERFKMPVFDGNFLTYLPEGVQIGGTALLLCIGMQHGIMGLTALLASDYARFLKPKDIKGTIAIGFIPQIFCYGVMGGLGIWFVVSGVAAMVLMLGGIVDHLDTALTFQGVFLLSWAAILVTDALVVKRILKIGPSYYEARQRYLYKWNPVGVASLVIASVLGTIAALGFMGTFLESTAAFFAAILASVLTVVIVFATKGAYYTRYETDDIPKEDHIA